MFVTLPALLLVLDAWPLRRDRPWRALLAEKLPLVVVAMLASVVTFTVQRAGGAVGSIERYSPATRLGNAVVTYVRYIGKLLWPTDLAAFYPHPRAWPVLTVVVATALIAIMTVLVLGRRRAQPWLAVGWLWYLGTLVPMLGLVQVGGQSMADRYTYLPTIGLLIALAWALPRSLLGTFNGRLLLGSSTAALLVAMTLATHRQIDTWRDSTTLWEHALAVTANNHVARTNLAVELLAHGQRTRARQLLVEELKLRPADSVAHNTFAAILAGEGDRAGAIEHYQAAVESNPRYALAHRNLAAQLLAVGRHDEACEHFGRAIAVRPDDSMSRTLLGMELARQGRMSEALSQFQAAVEADPADVEAQMSLGRALAETGKLGEGLAHLDEALRLRPDLAEAHYHAGVALARGGDLAAASEQLRAALAINPDDHDARSALEQLQSRTRSASINPAE
jgi:Flp pilus assembly protein TadD